MKKFFIFNCYEISKYVDGCNFKDILFITDIISSKNMIEDHQCLSY